MTLTRKSRAGPATARASRVPTDLDGNPLIRCGDGSGAIWLSRKQDDAHAAITSRSRYSCLVGGTRSGKTFLIVRAIIVRALKGAHSKHAILRFRANAARASIALDTLPNVVRLCFPGVKLTEHRQEGFFELFNGSQIWVGGLDDKQRVEKILGLEYATVFLNEASQIPYSSALIAFTRLAQVVPGLIQRAYVDLNPVGKSHWTNQIFGEGRDPISGKLVSDRADYQRAFLNPRDNAHNLSADFIRSLDALPEKHRRRFYEGLYVDEIDGALWTYEIIESCRCEPEDIPEDTRAAVVIAIDPSGASGKDDKGSDEIGIIVGARGQDGDGYVLDDRSLRAGPSEWARVAVTAYHEFHADCIVAESNFGGEMVRAVIHAADPNVPVRLVTASRGKAVRAEPVSTRYAKGQVHHVGRFPKLEEQLVAFSTNGYHGSDSPDHADAAVWALTFLLGVSDGTGIIEYYRRLADEQAKQEPSPTGWNMSNSQSPQEFVALYAPEGTSVVYGKTGNSYLVDADGVVRLSAEDAAHLRAAGFTQVLT